MQVCDSQKEKEIQEWEPTFHKCFLSITGTEFYWMRPNSQRSKKLDREHLYAYNYLIYIDTNALAKWKSLSTLHLITFTWNQYFRIK